MGEPEIYYVFAFPGNEQVKRFSPVSPRGHVEHTRVKTSSGSSEFSPCLRARPRVPGENSSFMEDRIHLQLVPLVF